MEQRDFPTTAIIFDMLIRTLKTDDTILDLQDRFYKESRDPLKTKQ